MGRVRNRLRDFLCEYCQAAVMLRQRLGSLGTRYQDGVTSRSDGPWPSASPGTRHEQEHSKTPKRHRTRSLGCSRSRSLSALANNPLSTDDRKSGRGGNDHLSIDATSNVPPSFPIPPPGSVFDEDLALVEFPLTHEKGVHDRSKSFVGAVNRVSLPAGGEQTSGSIAAESLQPPSVADSVRLEHDDQIHHAHYSTAEPYQQYSYGGNRPTVGKGVAQNLQAKRMEILILRTQAREKRASLRLHREDLVAMDALVLHRINQWQVSQNPQHFQQLQASLESCKAAHEEVQRMAIEYNELEDRLNRGEWDLKEAEARVFATLFGGFEDDLDDMDVDEEPDGQVAMGTAGSMLDRSPDLMAFLMKKFHSRVGDARLAQERLAELHAERDDLLLDEQRQKFAGRQLSQEGQEFLENFQIRRSELEENLARIQEDLVSLRQKIDDHNDILFRDTQFEGVEIQADQSDTLKLGGEDFKHNPTSAIVSNSLPDSSTVAYKTYLDSVESWLGNVHLFVNSWLLLLLQQSQMQWFFFKGCLGSDPRTLKLSDTAIKRLVLATWANDGTEPPLNKNTSQGDVS